MKQSFKTRVCNVAKDNAANFESKLTKYEYCICSKAFSKGFYITKTLRSNYLHLVGVNSHLSPEMFFKKCIEQTLNENDFNFSKSGVNSNELKGAVRDKIKVLPDMINIFEASDLIVQENFRKNKVFCAFASCDSNCTLGFALSGHPMSLLRGDYLDDALSAKVDLVLRRPAGSSELFSEIINGSVERIVDYQSKLLPVISPGVFTSDKE